MALCSSGNCMLRQSLSYAFLKWRHCPCRSEQAACTKRNCTLRFWCFPLSEPLATLCMNQWTGSFLSYVLTTALRHIKMDWPQSGKTINHDVLDQNNLQRQKVFARKYFRLECYVRVSCPLRCSNFLPPCSCWHSAPQSCFLTFPELLLTGNRPELEQSVIGQCN